MKKLGFGCMRFPLVNKDDSTSVDKKQVCEMFDYFIENGYTYFDTAFVYHGGESEKVLNECLVKRYPRDKFTITTKLFLGKLTSIDEAKQQFETQLQRLGVDYVDYYWLHAINRERKELIDRLNLFDFIKGLKAEGKVKHIGFSFHADYELLDQLLTEHPEVEFVQLQINYLDWNSPTIQSRLCYEVCVKHGKPVIVMEPVKGGQLANVPNQALEKFKAYDKDASPASWALKFVGDLDNVYMILSGMSNLEQVKDNVNTFNNLKKLNEEEKNIINENILVIQQSKPIPCTACRYCTDGCPMHIAIPDYFDLYNNEDDVKNYNYYIQKGFGKASDCIKCGACENICPQHLTIRDYLEEVVKKYETD